MKRRIGILTAGGDCPGLNACIRGVARASYSLFDTEIVGIQDGYAGLIEGNYREMKQSDFSGILTLGGTILGTRRTPFSMMRVIEDDQVDKVKAMKQTYKKAKLDCLVCLGGNGTHKTANLLSEEGLNIIGLPKTIDNDIWGTDVTFGFHSAVDCRHRRGGLCRPDQDRRAQPERARGEVQPAAQDRGGAGGRGEVPRKRGACACQMRREMQEPDAGL